uniref:Uncharacterized protein n=1 Tax=Glossina palpalis gambiensis TaxID=67801 RepID=A0A1B0B8P7_9MUSC
MDPANYMKIDLYFHLKTFILNGLIYILKQTVKRTSATTTKINKKFCFSFSFSYSFSSSSFTSFTDEEHKPFQAQYYTYEVVSLQATHHPSAIPINKSCLCVVRAGKVILSLEDSGICICIKLKNNTSYITFDLMNPLRLIRVTFLFSVPVFPDFSLQELQKPTNKIAKNDAEVDGQGFGGKQAHITLIQIGCISQHKPYCHTSFLVVLAFCVLLLIPFLLLSFSLPLPLPLSLSLSVSLFPSSGHNNGKLLDFAKNYCQQLVSFVISLPVERRYLSAKLSISYICKFTKVNLGQMYACLS